MSGPADEIWLAYFEANEPTPARVRNKVKSLHAAGEHEHAVRLIEAALIHSQSQPWMYEVLALSMELAGRPKDQIERVALSMSDFGQANYDSMLQSARYLAGFESTEASLRLLRQTASLAPERPEAYLVALPVAEKARDDQAIVWAASGVLATSHDERAEAVRIRSRAVAKASIAKLRRAGEEDAAAEAGALLADAETLDLRITLTWSGQADLDLEVTDPQGDVTSAAQMMTPGGGMLMGDGFGPGKSEEIFLAPRAFSGEYEVRVRTASGKPTGGRARLVVEVRQPDGTVRTQRQTLAIGDDAVGFAFTLAAGRRTKPRAMSLLRGPNRAAPGRVARAPRSAPIAGQEPPPRLGAVGFAPQISVLDEGSQMRGQAVVSPDRRYVRIGVQPWFTQITDVFTFTAVGGN